MNFRLRHGACLALLAVVAPTTSVDAMNSLRSTLAAECQFSSSLTIVNRSSCSAAYLGDGVVVTAAHCVNDSINAGSVYFGEKQNGNRIRVPLARCTRHPNGDFGSLGGYVGVDLAWCLLQSGAPNVPVIPPLPSNGCERDYVNSQVYNGGMSSAAVGLGCENLSCSPTGNKRYVTAGSGILRLVGQAYYSGSSKLKVRDTPEDTLWDGDSGGPLYQIMADGTYRLVGVTHGWNLTANQYKYWESVPSYLRWLETQSNQDLTPCHTYSGGSWAFTGGCKDQLVKAPLMTGRKWTYACRPQSTQAKNTFWGGGANACAGWNPGPGDITYSSEEFVPDSMVDELSVGIIAAQEGGFPGAPQTDNDVEEFFREAVQEYTYEPLLPDELAPEDVPLDQAVTEVVRRVKEENQKKEKIQADQGAR